MKRQLAALLLTIFALSLTACGETAAESETRTVYAMDTVMNLTVYGENAAAALESAEKELHTLDEAVLSRTAEGSELYALINSVCRQIVVLLPAAYLLSLTGRLELVWLAFPIAEVVSVILNATFLRLTYRVSLERK